MTVHAADESAAREALAAAHRIAVADGLSEGTWNHFSLMLDERRMLITPTDFHWSQVTPESLVLVEDDESARARGTQFYIGYRIHAPLHRVRPDAVCALHAHPPYATALSTLEDNQMLPISQMSVSFHGRVAYNEKYDLLDGPQEQGASIAAALGDNDVLLLRGHGVVVVGPTVEQAYGELMTLELACRTQMLAMATGRPMRVLTEAEAAQLGGSPPGKEEAARHFTAMREFVDAGSTLSRVA
jgi:ribulose-5-phosphate 4-epimerase/fuculose-1-phosphate aldolase